MPKGRSPKQAAALALNYQNVFLSPEGRTVLMDLIEHCHLVTPIRPGRDMEFMEGERNVALYVLTQMKWDHRDLAAFVLQEPIDADISSSEDQ